MLTLLKLHSESVAYYGSTVDDTRGTQAYYSEHGRQPARAWVVSVLADAEPVLEGILWCEQWSGGGGERCESVVLSRGGT